MRLVIVLTLLILANSQQPFPCTYSFVQDGITYFYDLSSAMLTAGAYHVEEFPYIYTMNVCANVPGKQCSVCQYMPEQQMTYSLSSWTISPAPVWQPYDTGYPTQGVTATFKNGDICMETARVRTTKVNFRCSTEVKNTFSVSEPELCTYTIDTYHPAYCAGPQQTCLAYTSPDGSMYDLSGLNLDCCYFNSSAGDYKYVMNVCGTIGDPRCDNSSGGICQYDSSGNFIAALASWKYTSGSIWNLINTADPTKGIFTKFSNEAGCVYQGKYYTRNTTLNLICDSSSMWPYSYTVDEVQMCNYVINFYTDQACPK